MLAVELTAVTPSFAQYNRIAALYQRSFSHIALGSRVLMAVNFAGTDKTRLSFELHIPALATIARSAMYSNEFAFPGQQPMRVRAPYRAAVPSPISDLATPDLLAAADGSNAAPPPAAARWIADWRDHYDYLYVEFAPEGYRPPLKHVILLDRTPAFSLYKIEHGSR
jgi:hypothetical protein